jgi:chromosome segregation ATPase
MQDKIENAVREEIVRAVVDVPMREQRSLATVTAEIRTIRAARDKMFLEASVEIGRRLKEAKELVGHGGWGNYCKTELDFSQQTAQNHIRLFEAYAADQIRLDGAALKSQTLGDLSYTQALELLALPSEEEREAFVREHDMDQLSTRELRAEIARLREEKEAAEADAREINAKKRQAEARAEEADKQCLSLQAELEAAQKALKLAAPEMAEFKVRFGQAQEALNSAVDALWELPSDKVDGGVKALRALLERAGQRLAEERYETAMPE